MKKYTILIDMDNTINDLTGSIIDSATTKLGIRINKNIIDDSCDITKSFITPPDFNMKNPLNYLFKQKDFWYNIRIYDGAKKAIDVLYNSYNIIFATTPYDNCLTCRSEKIEWLKTHFNWFNPDNHIIFSDEKWNLDGEMIIEDKPETLIKCKDKNKFVIKVFHGYNKFINCDLNIFDWKYRLSIISDIDKLFRF